MLFLLLLLWFCVLGLVVLDWCVFTHMFAVTPHILKLLLRISGVELSCVLELLLGLTKIILPI